MDDYTSLSALQAAQPEYAIFRRFMPLQTLQLNVMQTEIAHLRQGLGVQLRLDRQTGDQQKLSSVLLSSFEAFGHEAGEPAQSCSWTQQKALWDRLDATLERYSAQDPTFPLPMTIMTTATTQHS